MERLTTNKPVDEMSMLELAYNSCYAKDGKAMYQDFSFNTDARDLARHIMELQAVLKLPKDDEKFDEVMLDCLQYDPATSIVGTVALLYRNLWAMADMRERLKAYEDKQEQGLLLKLPCKVGDNVYQIGKGHYEIGTDITEYTVTAITISKRDITISVKDANQLGFPISAVYLGKRLYLTRSEAEEALAKMKKED